MERITLFADVLLPLPVPGFFTYRVPFLLNDLIKPGLRAVVQFGAKKIYTALIVHLHEKPPEKYIPKYILSLLDEHPVVNEKQLNFWNWLSDYYLCFPGEVMNTALPSALKLASETRIVINPDAPPLDPATMNEKELLLLESLHHRKVVPISEVARILDQQKTIPVIRNLIEKGFILSEEELNDPYRPRMEEFYTLSPELSQDDALITIFNELEKRAKKQLDLLMHFMHLTQNETVEQRVISKTELMKLPGASSSHLKGLMEKGILRGERRLVSRLDQGLSSEIEAQAGLSPAQQTAFEKVRQAFLAHDVVLLHGVTSSGKTEVYIRLIQEAIDRGRQVLFLLPEIALTTQIIHRLRKNFGARVGVYHSRFNSGEKVEIYKAVMEENPADGWSKFDIILGARSSVFLPFSRLGLVVIDEEHDPSFKQTEIAPRYNGRDAAIFLARMHGARVLLGSATPALETFYNVSRGKYAKVELLERYSGIELPETNVVDIKEAARQGEMKSHFSSILLQHLKECLARGEQAILFQNRRGFSLRLECNQCQWMPMCKNCDVTLVYHKKINQLRCHYCGYVSRIPERCPDCGSMQVKMKGFGTEKVEEELSLMLPGARIARMDLDTTKAKNALQQIISDFENRKIDILVGTQMVTKGLDFDHVSLVSILNADNMLSYPDFRSAERSYQLMAQVSGRSGRKNKRGLVIIQTRQPKHIIIQQVVENDYQGMYDRQLGERQRFGYPPFTRLILVKLKHRESDFLNKASAFLASELRKVFGNNILGPEYPIISKIMNLYIKHIMIKIGTGRKLSNDKDSLKDIISRFQQATEYKSVRVILDVDPQ